MGLYRPKKRRFVVSVTCLNLLLKMTDEFNKRNLRYACPRVTNEIMQTSGNKPPAISTANSKISMTIFSL